MLNSVKKCTDGENIKVPLGEVKVSVESFYDEKKKFLGGGKISVFFFTDGKKVKELINDYPDKTFPFHQILRHKQ